jgi:hypothetical protein
VQQFGHELLLKEQCHEIFFLLVFFTNQFPYPIRTVSNFLQKFAEIFASQAPLVSTTLTANLPPVSQTPAANFATSSASVVDTGGKFATGVSGKFVAGVNDTSGK